MNDINGLFVKSSEEFHCLVYEARRDINPRNRLEIARKNQELYR